MCSTMKISLSSPQFNFMINKGRTCMHTVTNLVCRGKLKLVCKKYNQCAVLGALQQIILSLPRYTSPELASTSSSTLCWLLVPTVLPEVCSESVVPTIIYQNSVATSNFLLYPLLSHFANTGTC